MLLAEISLWPMDKGESVGVYVAQVLDVIDKSGSIPLRVAGCTVSRLRHRKIVHTWNYWDTPICG